MKMTDKQVKYLEDLKAKYNETVSYAENVIEHRRSTKGKEDRRATELEEMIQSRPFPDSNNKNIPHITFALAYISQISAYAKRIDDRK